MARLTTLVMMLCAVQSTLCQEFDCSTASGQLAFLQNGAQSDPACYNPIINLVVFENNLSPTEIEEVCRARCAGVMIDFLRSTRECREDEGAQRRAHFLENELCGYKDGEGKPESSCTLQSSADFGACLGWWYSGGEGSECPALFPDFPVTAPSCEAALRTAVDEFGCCLQNLFGTEDAMEKITESVMLPPGTDVPSGFTIDVTDPRLYAACGVALPEPCETQSRSAAAPTLSLAPLVALLCGITAKLFA